MTSEYLIAQSNFKKTKGSSIGFICLLTVISFMLSLVLLIMIGFKPQAEEFTKTHNPPTGACVVSYDNTIYKKEDFTSYFESSDKPSMVRAYEGVSAQITLSFGSGTMFDMVFVESFEQMKSRDINQVMIVDEDESITENYIYMPYVLHTGGSYKVGDTYKLDLPDVHKELTIKGFYDSPCMTNFQYGVIDIAVDSKTMYEFHQIESTYTGVCIYYTFKDINAAGSFINDYSNSVLVSKISGKGLNCYNTVSTQGTVTNRTFMSDIISVAFLSVSIILIFVIVIMLLNSISTYIKENMKEIGALKAIGYTSINIRLSLVLQFFYMALAGTMLGISLSYIIYPIMAKILNTQTGIIYHISFVPSAVFITFFSIIFFIVAVVILCTIKIKKIEPIIALRDLEATHSFKRNYVPLSTSKVGIHLSLALKSFFRNMKQNIITGCIVLFLIFSGGLGIGMMYNFAIKPAYGLLTFEVFDGLIVTSDSENAQEVYDYLSKRDDVKNLRTIVSMSVTDDQNGSIYCYVVDHPELLNNNPVYKGRKPKYDNEIVVSGKYAEQYGYAIGDAINLTTGENSYSYLIVGLMQTTNNNGKEAFLSEEAYNHICDTKDFPGYFWFDSPNAKKVIEESKEIFGDKITSTTAFQDIIDSQLSLFVVISIMVAAVSISIAVFVMVLVLYLLIKSLLHSKRYEYGILKASGYTSKNLIFQTSISFMPSILVGAVLGVIVSLTLSNPFMTICMKAFGIMKCNFAIPLGLIIPYAIVLVLISFGITCFLSRKIKKLEPYNLLVVE